MKKILLSYDEYAIISVTLKNDALEFEGLAIDNEADEQNLIFKIDEIDTRRP